MDNERKFDPAIQRGGMKAISCKLLSIKKNETLFIKETLANSVPAAAVIQNE